MQKCKLCKSFPRLPPNAKRANRARNLMTARTTSSLNNNLKFLESQSSLAIQFPERLKTSYDWMRTHFLSIGHMLASLYFPHFKLGQCCLLPLLAVCIRTCTLFKAWLFTFLQASYILYHMQVTLCKQVLVCKQGGEKM